MKRTLPEKIIVSGCLAGMPCSHDGRDRLAENVGRLVKEGEALPICPEQLGGMGTPRETAEIIGGDGGDVLDGKARVISRSGTDLTAAFLEGAQRALEIARRSGCLKAVLKARSPSCGAGEIYDGSFSSCLKPGCGVTAALFMREGIEVTTDENL